MKRCFVVLVSLLLCGVWAAPTTHADPSYIGYFDVGDCNVIAGWAADRNRLNTPINVSIYDGTTLLLTVLANGSRVDSAAIGSAVGAGDNGLHAFNIPLPNALKNGQPHSISVQFESTFFQLSFSPRSITCTLPVAPRENVGVGVVLNAAFKLNNGAASTTNRVVGLNFSAIESSNTTQDVTGNVTSYRVKESPNLNDVSLSGEPWIPIDRVSNRGRVLELALRNGAGQRYGDRKVMFQVKTATLTSSVVSDTITLDPVLKEYRVSASTAVLQPHPLLKYASDQGFTFPLDYYETCKGDCGGFGADKNLASGTANVNVQGISSSGDNRVACVLAIAAAVITIGIAAPAAVLVCNQGVAPGPAGTCVTKVDYLMFEGRSPNQFWSIKSVDIPGSTVRLHGANRFRVKSTFTNSDGTCGPGVQISVGDVVVVGPEVDDFVDPANPWKNAFVRH